MFPYLSKSNTLAFFNSLARSNKLAAKTLSILLLSIMALASSVAFSFTKENPSYLSSAAIGVEDLDAAVEFYTQAMQFTEENRTEFSDRVEITLSAGNDRGSDFVLIDYTDDVVRDFSRNPGKIVFFSSELSNLVARIHAQGGQILLPPTPLPEFGGAFVGFARDLDNNLLELVGVPTADGTFMSAFGIGVSDLEAAREFYTNVIGLEVQTFLEITGQYDEYILESSVPGTSALVLMHWTNGSERNYIDNPIRLNFGSASPIKLSLAIRKSEATVSRYPRPFSYKGQISGLASDADGNELELSYSNLGYLSAAGVGVPDLDAAVTFYTEGLGMVLLETRKRKNRIEAVMESADGRGSQIILMQFTDGQSRIYDRNPGKIVFYVNDPAQFAFRFAAAGGQIVLPPIPQPSLGGVVVGFGRDLHQNLIEIVGVNDAEDSYLSAFGIGVSDLEAAKDYYVNTLGFKVQAFLSLPTYDEYILEGVEGSGLVLMHWTDGRPINYTDNPVKLEINTIAPLRLGFKSKLQGLRVKKSIGQCKRSGGELPVSTVYDADGTKVELFKAPWGVSESACY